MKSTKSQKLWQILGGFLVWICEQKKLVYRDIEKYINLFMEAKMEDGENNACISCGCSNLSSSVFLMPGIVFYKVFHILMGLGKERNTVAKRTMHFHVGRYIHRLFNNTNQQSRSAEIKSNFSYAHIGKGLQSRGWAYKELKKAVKAIQKEKMWRFNREWRLRQTSGLDARLDRGTERAELCKVVM